MAAVGSLPYYDKEPTDEERDAADLLVSRELPIHRPLHPAVSASTEWNPTSVLIQEELKRVARGEKLVAIDLARYENIESPNNDQLPEWRAAAKRNIVAADAMSNRMDNLSMLKTYGSNAWTMHVYQLEYALKQLETELLSVRQQIEQTNVERKRSQTAAGEKLTQLDDRWRALVSGNLELSVACVVLEREIEQLS